MEWSVNSRRPVMLDVSDSDGCVSCVINSSDRPLFLATSSCGICMVTDCNRGRFSSRTPSKQGATDSMFTSES